MREGASGACLLFEKNRIKLAEHDRVLRCELLISFFYFLSNNLHAVTSACDVTPLNELTHPDRGISRSQAKQIDAIDLTRTFNKLMRPTTEVVPVRPPTAVGVAIAVTPDN